MSYMVIGRPSMGESEVHLISKADSHEDAAKKAALSILNEQHENWDDDIYIDVVTDKNFNYKTCFSFSTEELRDNL